MRIGRLDSNASRQNGRPAGGADTHVERPAAASRALVALGPAPVVYARAGIHRQASFLAQLIATKDQLPQTRERRRAEPGEAILAYRAAARLMAD